MSSERKARTRRHTAIGALIENVLEQGFVPDDGNPVRVSVNGRDVFLPAYVPYVGEDYFREWPRVMCYAINQNLSPHRRWTADWTACWARNRRSAVNRLNRSAQQAGTIPIKPYTEGFIPLAAAMAMTLFSNGAQPEVIDKAISVTNFIKFSTASDASSSSIPASWWRECAKRYVEQEITHLQPEVILAFGQRTYQEVARVLANLEADDLRPVLLPCRFPGRIPSDKARPLTPPESKVWLQLRPLVERLQPPPPQAYHRWRMLRFSAYFVDLLLAWHRQPLPTRAANLALQCLSPIL